MSVAFCRVQITVTPAINIEVWLPPAANWNHCFQAEGGGGYAGVILYSALVMAVTGDAEAVANCPVSALWPEPSHAAYKFQRRSSSLRMVGRREGRDVHRPGHRHVTGMVGMQIIPGQLRSSGCWAHIPPSCCRSPGRAWRASKSSTPSNRPEVRMKVLRIMRLASTWGHCPRHVVTPDSSPPPD